MNTLPAETREKMLKGETSEVMMLGADRSREESGEGEFKTVHIWDGRQGKSLSLLPAQKRATVSNSNSANRSSDKMRNAGSLGRLPFDAAP